MTSLLDTALAYWAAGLTPLPRVGMAPTPASLDAQGTRHPIAWGEWKLKQPARCPTCGRRTFDPRQSGMLDMVALAKDVLSDLQAAIEEDALP
jgi:hypothetical protein